MRGLKFDPMHIPFIAGLSQKAEWRANQPPALDVALNVQFDDIGGLQLRKPFAALGSAQTDVRKIVEFGDELLMFTKDTLYSWSPTTSAWVSRGTHLAVAIDETTRFAGRSDQIHCDRAELNGTVVITWTETVDHADGFTALVGYVAAYDKTTGTVLMTPRALGLTTWQRARVVALTTKILLVFLADADSDLRAWAIDPANPSAAFGSASTIIFPTNANDYFDVEKIPGADAAVVACRRSVTTSYELKVVTAALALTNQATVARTCDGPIAVACCSNGAIGVIRTDGTSILADITNSSLLETEHDIAVGTATNTPINQVTGAFRSVADSGEFRCYVFWSAEESASASSQNSDGFCTGYNWFDTSAATGTAGVFVAGMGVGSRAFDRDGRIYVNLAFEGSSPLDAANSQADAGDGSWTWTSATVTSELQNAYFLYRDDAELVGKAVPIVGGGFSAAIGHLPGVQSLGSNQYAWCATERRRIPLSTAGVAGFAARSPRDCVIEFDTNRARRCRQLGRTLYVTGAEVKQFDGTALTEVGFHIFPWDVTLVQGSGGSGLADGDYFYVVSARSDNAAGERDRSPRVVFSKITVASGPDEVTITTTPVRPTHKAGVAIEIWRSAVNPADGSDFFLVTSPDPADTTTPNQYIQNPAPSDTSFPDDVDDELSDADLGGKEPVEQNAFPGIAPPGATIIAASDTRLFLAGIAGDPHRVWYSKQRNDGEVVAFHGNLAIDIPRPGGDVTAVALLNESLIVFRETAVYSVPGDGFDNAGGGQNYGPVHCISADIGAVSAEAVAVTPMGLLFKSSKGWYLLNAGQGLQYVGDRVADYDSETPLSVVVVESQHQIRILTASRLLVFDYLVNQWGEWTVASGVSACMWRGTYTYTTSTQPKTQATTYSGVDYAMDVETAWIKPADLMGECKVRYLEVLGEWRGDHDLWVRIAKDYDVGGAGDPGIANWHTTEYEPIRTAANGNVVGKPLDVRVFPAQQNCKAIKVRITAVGASDHGNPPSGEACRLTGLALDVAIRGRSGGRIVPPPSPPASG